MKRLIFLFIATVLLFTGCTSNAIGQDSSKSSTDMSNFGNNLNRDINPSIKRPNFLRNNFVSADDFSTVLIGSGSPNSPEGRACASTLIQYKGNYFLVDMGNGAQDRLEEAGINLGSIETLMFTHHHLDHNEEYFAVAIKGWLKGRSHLNLIGTPGTKDLHEFLVSFYKEDMEYRASKKPSWSWDGMASNVDIMEVSGDKSFELNGVTITTTKVPHSIHTQAYRFDAEDESIVISGDLTYSENLIKLAKDADVLVMDSGAVIKKSAVGFNSQSQKSENAKKKRKNNSDNAHASLEEVATMAQKAGVKKLVLTHIGGNIDKEAEINEISKIYTGEVIVGEDLMEVTP
ncbi:MBL fold metallo-hydrolase [Wukongibacter baidiensis]